MKAKLDKLKSKIRIKHNYLIFLIVIILIGIITGSLFLVILNEADKTLITKQLLNFFENISNDKLDYVLTLKNSLLSNILYLVIIWLLGISVIGVPIILVMFFAKAFVLGFSISNIIANFGFKGIVISFFYTFPHYFIDLLVYMILTMFSLSLSIRIVKSFLSKKEINFKYVFNKYFIVLLISILVILLCSCYETFVMPNILKFIKVINVK